MNASWYGAESILFNLWSPVVLGGHNRVKYFYICFDGENLWKSFQKPTEPKTKVQIYWQGDLMAIKKSNVACVHRQNISQYDSGERCCPWASCFHFIRICICPPLPLFMIYVHYDPCLQCCIFTPRTRYTWPIYSKSIATSRFISKMLI
jgi:hypothetical protein